MSQSQFLEVVLIKQGQRGSALFLNEGDDGVTRALAAPLQVNFDVETSPFILPYVLEKFGDKSALRFIFLQIIGALAGASEIIHPARNHYFIIDNQTTGGFAVTVKVSGQSGVSVPMGEGRLVYCDGSDVKLVNVASGVSVSTVFGRSGAVVKAAGDYDIDDLSDVDTVTTAPALGDILKFDNTNWIPIKRAESIKDKIVGLPGTSALVLKHVFTEIVTTAVNFSGSKAHADTAANAQADFDILKNGSSIGTMRFAAAGTVASFIVGSGQTFAIGDRLTITAPASQDSTLADIGINLFGERQ